MRGAILATYGATALAIGLLIGLPSNVTTTEPDYHSGKTYDDGAVIVQPTMPAHDGVHLGTWEGYYGPHCTATVDEGLDWYEEGPDDVPAAEEDILYQACGELGQSSEAELWEDGSWRVEATTGVWWRGCFSVGSCMDN